MCRGGFPPRLPDLELRLPVRHVLLDHRDMYHQKRCIDAILISRGTDWLVVHMSSSSAPVFIKNPLQ